MTKFLGVLVLIAVFGTTIGEEHPPGWIYGNDIPGHEAKVTKEHFQLFPNDKFDFGYKQDDLQERAEIGQIIYDAKDNEHKLDNVVGSYRYVRPDGLWQIVSYRADTKGFAPIIRTEPYIRNGQNNIYYN